MGLVVLLIGQIVSLDLSFGLLCFLVSFCSFFRVQRTDEESLFSVVCYFVSMVNFDGEKPVGDAAARRPSGLSDPKIFVFCWAWVGVVIPIRIWIVAAF